MKKAKGINALITLICIIIACIALFPLFWMALAGFKSSSEVLSIPFRFFPKTYHIENFKALLTGSLDETFFPEGASFFRSMLTTFLVAVTAVVGSLFINSMAGYVFARLSFPLKKILWGFCLIPWFVPGISTNITAFMVVSKLHLIDTLAVLILPGLAHSYSIFYYRQFYLGIPNGIEEAAKVDGAGGLQMYLKIFLPMSKTPFTIMGITVFLGYWSSFLWPVLTINNTRLYQINQLIAYFKSSYNLNMQYVLAAATIAALPTIALFLVFQKQIMQGIKISGMK